MAKKPTEYPITFRNEINIDRAVKAHAEIIRRRVETLPISMRDMAYDIIIQDLTEQAKLKANG